MRTCGLALAATLVAISGAWADPAPAATADDDVWHFNSGGDLTLDGGLLVGFPAALPTGLSRGVTAGITMGRSLAWGARVAWATATESTIAWTVTHSDLRASATGVLQHDAGRGTIGLRLGLGGTLVHETRTRNQGMRAGLTGSDLETTSFALLPIANLDAVIGLHIAGPWLVMMSGGPSVDVLNSKLHGGWSAELGVGWQP